MSDQFPTFTPANSRLVSGRERNQRRDLLDASALRGAVVVYAINPQARNLCLVAARLAKATVAWLRPGFEFR